MREPAWSPGWVGSICSHLSLRSARSTTPSRSTRSASPTTCWTPPSVMSRWPQFRLPDGLVAIHQPDAAIVPAARGTRVMQDQARKHGADLRELTPVLGVRDLGSSGVEVETANGAIRCGGLVVCADAWVNYVLGGLGHRHPARGDPRAGHLLRAAGPDWLRPGSAAALDLDGRPVVLRLPVVRRAEHQGGPGLRRSGDRPGTARVRGRRAHAVLARRAHATDPARAVVRRSSRCAASTP